MVFTTDNVSDFFQTVFSKVMLYEGDREQFLKEIEELKSSLVIWHDIRKNPEDLPEKVGGGSEDVYISYDDGVTDFAWYDFNKKWWVRSIDDDIVTEVVAWTDIPVFKSETNNQTKGGVNDSSILR